MKNIRGFLKKTYNEEKDFEKKREESKMITFEVDLDYVLNTVGESLKTDETVDQNNIERIQKVFNLYFVQMKLFDL